MAEELYQSGTISTKSKNETGRRLVKQKVKSKFPTLSFSTVGYKEVFPPQPPRKRKLEGGGHREQFRAEYRRLVLAFDNAHNSNLYEATITARNGIPTRVEGELLAAGRSRPMFGRRNPEIEAAKQAIYTRGLADTRAMLVAAGNALRNLDVLNPNQYGDFFVAEATRIMPNTDMRTTIVINRFIQQYRRFLDGFDGGWINYGSDIYLALIRRLNDEVRNGLNQIVNMAGNIISINPAAEVQPIRYRDIPRGEVDGVTYEEIVDGEDMIDYDRNYASGNYLKASTADDIPLRNRLVFNPFTNDTARIIQPYLARIVDAPTGGRIPKRKKKKLEGDGKIADLAALKGQLMNVQKDLQEVQARVDVLENEMEAIIASHMPESEKRKLISVRGAESQLLLDDIDYLLFLESKLRLKLKTEDKPEPKPKPSYCAISGGQLCPICYKVVGKKH